jgi:hypothetical protein
MDDQKILPSTETIRRFSERADVLYEQASPKKRYKRQMRDTSEYYVNEPAPTEALFHSLKSSLKVNSPSAVITTRIRRYLGKWANWLRCGLNNCHFVHHVKQHLPSLYECWNSDSLKSSFSVA